jgi:hypothetical protein
MNTSVYLRKYLAQFFLEWEIFQTKVAENIKAHILCSITFFRKSCSLWDNVEKYGTARHVADGSIVRRMHKACWVTKSSDTHSEYVILLAFPWQQWLRERAQCYFISTLALVFPCFCFSFKRHLNIDCTRNCSYPALNHLIPNSLFTYISRFYTLAVNSEYLVNISLHSHMWGGVWFVCWWQGLCPLTQVTYNPNGGIFSAS